MKRFSTLLAINLIISTFFGVIVENSSKFAFLNCSFIIGMLYFLSGLFCFVWEKGFFNITSYSFNKISQQMHRKMGMLDGKEISLDDYIYRDNNLFITNSLLSSGALISIICIIVSFIYI